MSVEFSNAYQEILLDNLVGVIKQNFVFQTQIKLLESGAKEKENLEKSFFELKTKYDELNNLYNLSQNDLKQIDIYKSKAEQNNSAHEEKNRIQSALNEEMRKLSNLKKELDGKNSEIEKLKEYVSKLEEIAPVSKLKKIKVFEEVKSEIPKIETPKIENKLQVKVLNGSSF
jgi:predicted  nucleic acid-binding Zn-ribbon protein